MPVGKALYTSFTGISPAVAEEICHLAGVESAVTAKDISPDVLVHLYRQFSYYIENVRVKHFEPVIYYDNGAPK